MRLIAASIVCVLATAYTTLEFAPAIQAEHVGGPAAQQRTLRDGQAIFRFDTFGDEQLWTGVLRMHEAVAAVDPATALAVGLKVDVDSLPPALVAALRAGQVDLKNPAVTAELLRLNAVVGLKGTVSQTGRITSVGVTCALCHSSVDDSFAPGIGRRLDGWANRSLNVGAIVALSPALDDATREEFRTWGPGKYDPRHHVFDGTNILSLNSPSVPIAIPPIYGLRGVGFETYTADGPIWYWNSYVGVGQMGGHGSFSDPRLGITIAQTPDLVTPKLPALLAYQLSLRPPTAPKGSFDQVAAARGGQLFRNEAGCASCHQPPNYTDVLERPRSGHPVSARSRRRGHGPDVCRAHRNREVPDDAIARAAAASAVLPRRERAGPAGRRRSLRQPVRAAPDRGAEGGSGRVPQVAVRNASLDGRRRRAGAQRAGIRRRVGRAPRPGLRHHESCGTTSSSRATRASASRS